MESLGAPGPGVDGGKVEELRDGAGRGCQPPTSHRVPLVQLVAVQDVRLDHEEILVRPRFTVVDTVDFCPGGAGAFIEQSLTVPLSQMQVTSLGLAILAPTALFAAVLIRRQALGASQLRAP